MSTPVWPRVIADAGAAFAVVAVLGQACSIWLVDRGPSALTLAGVIAATAGVALCRGAAFREGGSPTGWIAGAVTFALGVGMILARRFSSDVYGAWPEFVVVAGVFLGAWISAGVLAASLALRRTSRRIWGVILGVVALAACLLIGVVGIVVAMIVLSPSGAAR
jgi:hypothetical protein